MQNKDSNVQPTFQNLPIGNAMLAAFVHFFKLRYTAEPFDIVKERVCKKGENGRYWLGYDGKIYFGNRWLIFSYSYQNSWWLSRNCR